MKKLLLVGLALVVAGASFGQAHSKYEVATAEKNYKMFDGTEQIASTGTPERVQSTLAEASLFTTEYDLQSNSSLSGRMVDFGDGTMAIVGTRGFGDFADRGTGYNYFDGSAWGEVPTEPIEAERTGWPSIAPYGANGEIVISHNGGSEYLVINYRENKGTGDWTMVEVPMPAGGEDLTWPRIATSGADNKIVHILAAYQNPDDTNDNRVFYTRSTDELESFEEWTDPADITVDYAGAISADDYVMAAMGDYVAISCYAFNIDIFYLLSDDNGESWEKTVVWEMPYPQAFEDFESFVLSDDTLYTCDNSGSVTVDADGIVHMAWGTMRWWKDEVGTSYTWQPWMSNGIGYWNSTMEPLSGTGTLPSQDLAPEHLQSMGNLIGIGDADAVLEAGVAEVMQYRSNGFCTMPNLSVGPMGVACSYVSAVVDNNGINYFRRPFISHSYDYNVMNVEPYNLAQGVIHSFDECIYPVMPPYTHDLNAWHMATSIDVQPGVLLDAVEQTEATLNTYTWFDLNLTGVNDNAIETASSLTVSPNPVRNIATLDIDAENNVNIAVYSITGQRVIEMNNVDASSSVSLDVQTLTSGVYFVTVTEGARTATQKIIVE